MMQKIVLLLIVSMAVCGCDSAPELLGSASPVTGKLTLADGGSVGKVVLVLQPLGSGHVVMMETDDDGKFQGEAIPGEYAYYVAKSTKAGSAAEAALKKVPAEFLEATMERKVAVGQTPELEVVLQ
jgi:hypothetical protein